MLPGCSTVAIQPQTLKVAILLTAPFVCVIGRSEMCQIVELRRGRTYGADGVTNGNKSSAANDK